MKNIRVFVSENFQFLEVKFSIHLNRRVFVMVNVDNKLQTTIDYVYIFIYCSKAHKVFG